MMMLLEIIAATIAILIVFGIMYWLADSVDKEEDAVKQYDLWYQQFYPNEKA
jgi:hypothetical protein